MSTALDDDGVEEDAAMSTWTQRLPHHSQVESEVAASITLPDSVSRFSRFRSARISDAC